MTDDPDVFPCTRCGKAIYHAQTYCPHCGLELYPQGGDEVPAAPVIPAPRQPSFFRQCWRRLIGLEARENNLYLELLQRVNFNQERAQYLLDAERALAPEVSRSRLLTRVIAKLDGGG